MNTFFSAPLPIRRKFLRFLILLVNLGLQCSALWERKRWESFLTYGCGYSFWLLFQRETTHKPHTKSEKSPQQIPSQRLLSSTLIYFSKLSGETRIHHSCFRNWQASNYVSLFRVLLPGYFFGPLMIKGDFDLASYQLTSTKRREIRR